MAKQKKLSRSQHRRIQANRSKRLDSADQSTELNDESDLLGAPQSGTVITRYGQHADIEHGAGEIVKCNIRRTAGSVVCGDEVVWRPYQQVETDFAGVIEAVQPRRSEFVRPDFYDGLKPVAANIDQIFIVSALLPDLTPSIIDRYLVAIEQLAIRPVIVINKIDLLDDGNRTLVEQVITDYQKIGYQVITVSAQSGQDIEMLQKQLADHISIFVGQSGVGKSSLINQLLPELNIATKQVSENSRLGQHTTTASRLYRTEYGGAVIDSPGVREFAMWHLEAEQIFDGFVEFAPYKGHCKFRDCKHQNDPGCAIKEAVIQGNISELRYQSYLKIVQANSEVTLRHNSKQPVR